MKEVLQAKTLRWEWFWMCLQKKPKPEWWYMEGQADLCDFQARQDYIGKPYLKIIK